MLFNITFYEIKESIFFFFLKYLKFYSVDRPWEVISRKELSSLEMGERRGKVSQLLEVSLCISPDGNSLMIFKISEVLFH